ncbi:MAG: ribosome biogenesis GTP-binding protein YihA/YsxC [Firmicutes bacterium]|nr:ribosome biogenesis GTP-binding protein YihA/YsxC [Bacillota bacterium]
MLIKQSSFLTSVADIASISGFSVPEIAVAGKSNVGKSSFINFITNNSKLAKTSKDPGRTRLLNYFSINNDSFRFVDLPGYGYARVSNDQKEKWGGLIENYLKSSKNLKNVFLLIDIRREPSADDKMIINFLYAHNIQITLIATKADKFSRSAVIKRKAEIAKALAVGADNIILTSSLHKTGKEEVFARIAQVLEETIV